MFRKNGLNIDLTHIPTTQAVQALVGGKIQFTTTGPQIIEANLAGADTVYIWNPVNTFVFSIYSKPEIASVKGLAGKTIGATNKGTPTDIAGHMVLAQSGLKPDVDVKFAYLKELPALVTALQQGIIDAAILSAPSTLTARNLGFKELLNITALKIPFVQHGIGTTRSFISANQDLVRRLVRSAAEGIDYARKNRADAIAIMSKYTKINDQVVLQKAYDFYMSKVLEKTPAVNMAGVVNVLDDLAKSVPAAKNAKPEQFVDMRFLDTLEKSGLLKELYP